MKKILIVSTFPAPYRVNLFELLAEQYEVRLFFEKQTDQERNPKWYAKNKKLHFEYLDTQSGANSYRQALKHLKDYSIVFIYDYWTTVEQKLQLLCRILKIPFVLNCDGCIMQSLNKKNLAKDIAKKLLIKKANAYMCGGEAARQYFLHYGANEANTYIYHFSSLHSDEIDRKIIGVAEKKLLRKKYDLPIDSRIVLTVGQFISRKNIETLIKAWKNVNDEQGILLIVGGGPLGQQYEELADKLSLSNIMIRGFYPSEEIREIYHACDLFVLPTKEDIWGLVINEAMASGLPVVTTNCCGAGIELIENGQNGFIVSPQDIDGFTRAMQMFLEDEALRLNVAEKNLQLIKGYNIENMAQKHLEVIDIYGK